MEDYNILNNIEFDIFNKFSQKLNPKTKNDYLSKIVLMKVYLEGKGLLEVTKYDCNDFIDYIKDNKSVKTFDNFCILFETIVGYYYGFGGEKLR